MQNAQNIIIKALEVFPNTEPKEITLSIRDMITTLDNIGRIGHTRPFGGAAINVNCTVEGMQSGQPFNRTIIDGNGAQTIDAYGVFYVSWRGHVPTPDEIAMYKHLFSLEECAKPIEERIKTIKEYFPNGVEGVLMPDPNNIPEADRKYITHPTDTPSYTRPVTPSHTSAVPVKNKDYTPHCPICGSPDIEKITLGQKAFGGIMFGLFSKTAKSQFKCNNCGAKF